MIVVRIELWPHGDPSRKRFLGEARIANDLQATLETNGDQGSYEITLSTWHQPPRVWKRGRVQGFDRRRRGPWDLLGMALVALLGGRLQKARTP